MRAGSKLPVWREILSDWTLWFDEDARWEDGPQSVDAGIEGRLDDWVPVAPTPGWAALDSGCPVTVPAVTDAHRPAYHGVSWWSTTVELGHSGVPILEFGAARLLAEVFWDQQLIGVDLEGYTPFRVEVPRGLASAGTHRVDVRITNPGGSAGWEDLVPIEWGSSLLPSSHDFGGLWQPVRLEVATSVRIVDLSAIPTLDMDAALVDVTVETQGPATLRVQLLDPSGNQVATAHVHVSGGLHAERVTIPVAEPTFYGPGMPNRYCVIALIEDDDASDEVSTHFGFRTLDVSRDGGLLFNGEPFYLRTAISWGRYTNGPVPTEQEIRDEVDSLVALGQNAVTAHRSTVTPALAEALEEAGLLLYQEPGGMPSLSAGGSGWLPDEQIAIATRLMEKRIRRLARRDRGRACLVWWNLGNEVFAPDDGDPGVHGWRFLHALREEDDSRIATFASAWNPTPLYRPFVAEPAQSFDFHTVLNWPAGWSAAVEELYGSIRPPHPMPVISGESTNMAGLGWLVDQANSDARDGESAAARGWLDALDRDLAQMDPEQRIGGVAGLCHATAQNQTYGTARMIEANRANTDIDGLAINGWHSHSAIGAQGLTGPNRRLSVDAEPIRRANASLTIAVRNVIPVVAVGNSQTAQVVLLDDARSISGEVRVGVRQGELRDADGGRQVFDVRLPPSQDRVHHLLDLALEAAEPGLKTVEVSAEVGGLTVSTEVTFRVVATDDLAGHHIAVHDPLRRLSGFLSSSLADVEPWPQLLSGPARRSVCLLDSHPSGEGGTMFTRLRLGLFRSAGEAPETEDLSPYVDVKGHWIGGWGVTLDPDPVPTLAETTVWDWTLSSLMPTLAFRPVGIGQAVHAAVTFPDGGPYTMGTPRVCPTTLLLERGERQVLVTTLPLADRSDRDPLAAAVLADLIGWACESPTD
jgi:hypothetical protein